jgi:hypothetical protein
MLLSEAIIYGSTLRPESHQGPFIRIANTGELASDVYGAACEAVYSIITKERNWNEKNKSEYRSDIEFLREILHRHFERYFQIAVTCPGAKPGSYSEGAGRFTGRVVGGLNDVAIEGERVKAMPAITTACPSIVNFAEYLEHAFYVHGWSREQCAQAAEHVEHGDARQLVTIFEHYQDSAVQRRTAQRLTAVARERELQRHTRRRIYAAN